jgi:hypothetical protein
MQWEETKSERAFFAMIHAHDKIHELEWKLEVLNTELNTKNADAFKSTE